MLTPYTKKRPTRTPDGQGGFTESLPAGGTIYGAVRYQDSRMTMVSRRETDVVKGDFIVIDSEDYRVTDIDQQDGSDFKTVHLEKVAQPT